MDKKVSVIIPAYNAEKYIKRCVDSISAQSYKDLEIIVVDDGSKDNTLKICNEMKERDDRLVVISKANGGVSAARNMGLSVAKGDYIMFVDADDTIESRMIDVLVNSLDGYDLVYSKYKKIKADETIYINEYNIKNLNDCDRLKYFIGDKTKKKKNMLYKSSIMGSVWRILFRKKVIDGLEFNSELKYSEDFLFMMQVFEKNPKISYIDEYLYNYYENDTSFTSSVSLKKIDYLFQIVPYMEKYFADKYRKQLDYFYVGMILNVYYILRSNNLKLKNLDKEKQCFVKKNLKFIKIMHFNRYQSNIKSTILAILIKLKLK